MLNRIKNTLAEIEREEGVRILYACESGSRAWGFPSANSDFDVRFIYIRPKADYLRLDEPRDVIERPIVDDLDINGWDLRKTLRLFQKSNPTLMEWLDSPIVYREETGIAQGLRSMTQEYYQTAAACQHYLSMAKINLKASLQGDLVSTKKYFYALRPLLAIQWIKNGWGPAPTAFHTMMERLPLDPTLLAEIHRLMELKKAGDELGQGPRNAILSDYLEQEIARQINDSNQIPKQPTDTNKLNKFFLDSLEIAWNK